MTQVDRTQVEKYLYDLLGRAYRRNLNRRGECRLGNAEPIKYKNAVVPADAKVTFYGVATSKNATITCMSTSENLIYLRVKGDKVTVTMQPLRRDVYKHR